nr:tetratricopeptide repeat protein [Streptomyces boncukensis]
MTAVDFTGREALVAELRGQLTARTPTIAVAGAGGVGKTTLAVHVAHAVRERYPDGQLYVDLHGADATAAAEPETVLGAFLRSLGVDEAVVPDGLEERAALYRSQLADSRTLVLLDNARDAAQIRPLLPGTESCTAVITSRARLVDLAGAHQTEVEVMEPGEGLALFVRIAGEARVAEERSAATDVVAACGYLPLAIRIAASRLTARPRWSVAVLAAKLADEQCRLEELRVGDQRVAAAFELGYGHLGAEQARAFRLLGVVDGPDISLSAASALLDRAPRTAEDILESLVDVSLVETVSPGRYRFHDLVRLFARDRAGRDEAAGEPEAAFARLLGFYLATARAGFARERPGERTIDHLGGGEHAGLAFDDRDAALSWLFEEANCLLATVRQASAPGTVRQAADLLFAAKDLGDSGVHSPQFEQAGYAVRDAARSAGDASAEARALIMLAHVHFVAGRFDPAEEEARASLPLADESGDVLSRSYALHNLSIIANVRGSYDAAEEYHRLALAAFRADHNRPSEASALCMMAHICVSLGRTESAIELSRQGLHIYQELGHGMRVANARNILAQALAQADRTAEALEEFDLALALFREARQTLWEGAILSRKAETLLAANRPDEAARHAEQSLAMRAVGGEWMRARTLTTLGRAQHSLGAPERARECWREALEIFERQGSREAAEVAELLETE